MKIKVSTTLMLMSLVVLLTACGVKNSAGGEDVNKVSSSNSVNTCSGTVIFSGLSDEMDSLQYNAFDESKVNIKDKKIIKNLICTLKENNYVQLDEDEYVEGFYSFTFIAGNDSVSIGIGEETVAIDGGQYKLQGNDILISDELKRACKIK